MGQRVGSGWAISYPDLPVTAAKDEIAAAIRDHQVVIVAGETGSGKTTQLPKICLELGRGSGAAGATGAPDGGTRRGAMIGHTQPRRIAARSVAERIADELGTTIGDLVGYAVRFTDQVSDATAVKVMTDGILLAEIQRDRMLRRYDTIIIDEAHERSLNIDFLLGYLKRLLPRRPDLKLIITSATIDPERFSRHFGGAPIIEVSGRTYPVEIRYRPIETDRTAQDDEDDDPPGRRGEAPRRPAGRSDQTDDPTSAVVEAVEELAYEGEGDILVFLSGEREIRDTAEALAGLEFPDLHPVEIMPLFARLSSADQHRVFSAHTGRRVVLATNVAETSLTVPGIRYVVDPGTARISRYSHRTKVQRLPIEAISQASARQRAGRCGRVSEGICVRLYSEEDHDSRPEFTDPEILRTNLASVILQMAALGIGEIEDFPFVEPPDRRSIRDGVLLLEELGALKKSERGGPPRLTDVGRRLSRLPVDPRLGRMVLEAGRLGCLREVLVVVAALSIQDPRERPLEKQEQAAQSHARFRNENSDLLSYLVLWEYLREKQRELSSSAFRRMCKQEFLHYLRVREWQDLVSQLRRAAASVGLTMNTAAGDPDDVHRAVLTGLLSQLGMKDPEAGDAGGRGDRTRGEYLGARGVRFAISPGSTLFKRKSGPGWVMAGELVETTRMWARDVARIDPAWIEGPAQAAGLAVRTYSEPRWDARRGSVMATEKVTVYGLPVVPARSIGYARVDPELSRELFIRHALVEGDWRTHHGFLKQNRALVAEVEELESRTRRRGILADDETLFGFYDARVPKDVVSGRHFDSWWKKARRAEPELLTFTRELLVAEGAHGVDAEAFPDTWFDGELALPLGYHFEPGAEDDGVTVTVPVDVLNRVDLAALSWQVPGLREDLVTAMIRALPKALRRSFVPAPNYARDVTARLDGGPDGRTLLQAVVDALNALGGPVVTRDDVDREKVPGHLLMRVRVVDGAGRVLGIGTDPEELRTRLAPKLQDALAAAAPGVEVAGLTDWPEDDVPATVEQTVGGRRTVGYPALADEGATVAVRVFGSEAEQAVAMRAGTRRLLALTLPSPAKAAAGRLSGPVKLALAAAPAGRRAGSSGTTGSLFDDCLAATLDLLVERHGGAAWGAGPWARDGWEELRLAVRQDLVEDYERVLGQVGRVMTHWQRVQKALGGSTSLALLASVADARSQVEGLVRPGFVTEVGAARLPDVVRYLEAVEARLQRLPERAVRDRDLTGVVQRLEEAVAAGLERVSPRVRATPEAAELRWMLQELRVSLFAPGLRTAYPISEKRIERALASLGA